MYISYYNVGTIILDDDDDDEGMVGVIKSSWIIAFTTIVELHTGCFLEEGLFISLNSRNLSSRAILPIQNRIIK